MSLPISPEIREILQGALQSMRDNERRFCATSDIIVSLAGNPAGMKELEKYGINRAKADVLVETLNSGPCREMASLSGGGAVFSDDMNLILNQAGEMSEGSQITPEDLLEALMSSGISTARMIDRIGKSEMESPSTPAKESKLDTYTTDMVANAADGMYDPVIGREAEIDEIVEVVSRRKKKNVALTGDPGVGKSAIVEALASGISNGEISELASKRLLQLDMAALTGGTGIHGALEDRVVSILSEIKDSDDDILLFLDEGHTLAGSQSSSGMNVGDMLKPALARGQFGMIFATTNSEYKQIERSPGLSRRFTRIDVRPIKGEKLIEVLRGIKASYQDFHGVAISDDVIALCVSLSDRFVTDGFQPDKAINLLDRTCARVRIEGRSEVSREDVASVVSSATGIPAGSLTKDKSDQFRNIEQKLSKHIVGHEDVLSEVSRSLKASAAGIRDRSRPIGTFLFCGPTGVGKTETAKAIAKEIFGDEDSLVRVDMSEFHEPHSISRLIGAPPGYVGFGKGGELTEKVKTRPFSVVLFDEVEKAHPNVHTALLQLLDDGRLTDSEGNTVDFTNTVVIMTSNIGVLEARKKDAGFTSHSTAESRIRKAVEKAFPPEFTNRIDGILVFESLTPDQIKQIACLTIERISERALEQDVSLTVEDAVVEKLATDGFDSERGARQMERHITRTLEGQLADIILDPSTRPGASVTFTLAKDGVKARRRNGR